MATVGDRKSSQGTRPAREADIPPGSSPAVQLPFVRSALIVVVVVVTALAFDFTNGFHDTANALATSIAE